MNMNEFRIHCTYCKQDISKSVVIKCEECEDVTLCTQCFSTGKQIHSHKRTHDYQVLVSKKEPIYQKEWTYIEELKLLEGLDRVGFGNWEGIAKIIKTKTKNECKEHFEQVYLTSRTFPFPSQTGILPSTQELSKSNPRKRSRLQNNPIKEEMKKKTGLLNKTSKTNTGHKNKHKKKKTTKKKQQKESKTGNKNSKITFSELAGFMPKREDFEIYEDDDYETIVESFGFDDEKISWNIKYPVLEALNLRIEDREKKRQLVLKMGLENSVLKKKSKNLGSDFYLENPQIAKLKKKHKISALQNNNKYENDMELDLGSKSQSNSSSSRSEIENQINNLDYNNEENTENENENENRSCNLDNKNQLTIDNNNNNNNILEQMNGFMRCFKSKKQFKKFQKDFLKEFKIKSEINTLLALKQLEPEQKHENEIPQISTPRSKRFRTKRKKKLDVITTPRTRLLYNKDHNKPTTTRPTTRSVSKKKQRMLTHN
ncbi:transcriptional adapter 2-alpha [Anaeramoeba flamelloides]|uniref:Transcriptional adapter 2-alpha n=1 Tax=Anaeramoeba flamelloides TaxID=1746091 RepID=A0ABQ8ZEB8_9EUKA|nr:transcriptional adapter 2-alpha [Anaeramoeba flamelloides]